MTQMSYSGILLALPEAERMQMLVEVATALSNAQLETAMATAWTPIPDSPQERAYESPADELFFGGAAGGGKSSLLLGVAGTAQSRSIVFRRIFPSLRGLIEDSRQIFNRGGATHAADSFNESLHMWRLYDERTLEFAAMQYDKDKEKYRGRPYDFYGFDEITEFTEQQYRFVTAWNRTTRPGQRCRVICTGNPPASPQGEWVVKYWGAWLDPRHSNPARPGELRWYARVDDADVERPGPEPFIHNGETITPRSRTFIPARLADNPYLRDTGYLAIIQALPEPLRSQMLYGDFGAHVADDPYQVIPTEWVEAAMNRKREREREGGGPARQPAEHAKMTALGVDVARGGADATVLAPLYGFVFGPVQRRPGKDTPNGQSVVQLIIAARPGDATVGIDVIGIGASAYDQAAGLLPDVRPIHFGEGTDATDKSGRLRFRNVRAAAYWAMREALDPVTGAGITLPDDAQLKGDLCAPRWSLSGGRVTIEDKEAIRERLGRSPDAGDAVVLAWYSAQTSAVQIWM